MNARSKKRKAAAPAPVRSKPDKAAAQRKLAAGGAGKRKAAPRKPGPRADFGGPIDGFFAKQPAALRPLLETLRALIEEAAPKARASLKWGMPFYELDGVMMCALAGHKAHVNLMLPGPDGTYADPEGRLTGESKNGRHLKLTAKDEVPRSSVRTWLRTATKLARAKA